MDSQANQVQILVDPLGIILTAPRGINLLELLQKQAIPLIATCGGHGPCGQCQIQVISSSDPIPPPSSIESKILASSDLSQGFRLACQFFVTNDIHIYLSAHFLETPDAISQINTETGHPQYTPIHIENPWHVDSSITSTSTSPEYGVALDVGTTTMVGYLVNLHTGMIVQTESILNPQIPLGEDVISRIYYGSHSASHAQRLQDLVWQGLCYILQRFLHQGTTTLKQIRDISIVGNTAMHHFFYGLKTDMLGRSPFLPTEKHSLSGSLSDLGLPVHHLTDLFQPLLAPFDCSVYSPPLIGGFVGADTVADILSIRQDLCTPLSLLIDIGTNGEIVLGNQKQGLIATSCAAGPAFEGAHIRNGMRGYRGAIEHVTINPTTLTPAIQVIGNTAPLGICGSGLIDCVAEFLRCHIITRSGAFNKKFLQSFPHPRINAGPFGPEYILHSSSLPAQFLSNSFQNGSSFSEDLRITITQSDIREIQKAKAAFLAGIALLLAHTGHSSHDLEHFFLAGGFGSYLNKINAQFIGLIPDIRLEAVYQLGNAAGRGAQALLLDHTLRQTADRLVPLISYFNLASTPQFQTEYAEAMFFPHRNLERFPSLISLYESIPVR